MTEQVNRKRKWGVRARWSIIQTQRKQPYVIFKRIDGTGNHHVMQDKPGVEDSTMPFLSWAESMFFNIRHEKQNICEKEEGQ